MQVIGQDTDRDRLKWTSLLYRPVNLTQAINLIYQQVARSLSKNDREEEHVALGATVLRHDALYHARRWWARGEVAPLPTLRSCCFRRVGKGARFAPCPPSMQKASSKLVGTLRFAHPTKSSSSDSPGALPRTPPALRRGRGAGRRGAAPDAPSLRSGASLSGSPRRRPRQWRRRR